MATEIEMGRVQVDNPAKSAAKIEWNVDMKVTVSNAKQSKLFQRSRTIVFFLLAIVFAVILSHLRTEVRALQAQVQSVNMNLLLLMSKYDRLNRNLNRVSVRRFEKLLVNKRSHDAERLLEDTTENLDEVRNESSRAYNRALPHLNSIRSSKEDHTIRDQVYDDGNGNENENTVSRSLRKSEDNESSTRNNNLRIERAILAIENENATTDKEIRSSREMIADDNTTTNYYDNVDDDDDDDDDELRLGMQREPRSGRSKRDEGRGPLVATFVGAIPEQHVTDTVFIGPWVRSTKNDTQYSLNKFHLVEDKRSIEVTQTGLYMISAQVMPRPLVLPLPVVHARAFFFQIFYFGEPTNYSYWILLNSEGKSNTEKLVKCSTASSTSATEVSCYTSVITPLRRGDRVHIQQQEKGRLINMREGHSYVQLVLLSKTIRKKRLR
ncbi:uncharacterized protein LOC108631242 isoform X2 [Ceratina calcarata]|uniref:Uncharacterized protein LOC108631242 isoform X2 n=1 Tax=Ceratina calcarata TaxID=156304 RepID=A0AAJ7SAZ3_9HYME|nr:uncharacterized protein LOC108631242 isoform X2 [Ceratina calcarata]